MLLKLFELLNSLLVRLGRQDLPQTTPTLDERIGRLVVHRCETGDVADELVQQGWLDQVCLLRNERLLRQHNLLGSCRVRGQETPVDVAAITQVRVVTVLEMGEKLQFRYL